VSASRLRQRSLEAYRKKRDFKRTPEPRGRVGGRKARALSFVIQEHAARSLHYDFRLELSGALVSWAIPKGPSLDPSVKRLAVHVEDHPLEYGGFEGVIPEAEYGAGTVLVWDRGTWIPRGDPNEAYARGHLDFELKGRKLHGGWSLLRTPAGRYGGRAESWLLVKHDDRFARRGARGEIVASAPNSVVSGRSLEKIGAKKAREVMRERPTAPVAVKSKARTA
jgi:bifunctional non-homologous end joining protein LigD